MQRNKIQHLSPKRIFFGPEILDRIFSQYKYFGRLDFDLAFRLAPYLKLSACSHKFKNTLLAFFKSAYCELLVFSTTDANVRHNNNSPEECGLLLQAPAWLINSAPRRFHFARRNVMMHNCTTTYN